MGLYADIILPRLMDWTLRHESVARYRRAALAEAHGDVLEVGFGTGLNLPHYPAAVRTLTAVDASPAMGRLARARIAASPIPVEQRALDGERLPFPDEAFDTVVSTFTLCSIEDVGRALAEMRRVLKPDGRYVFLEHGLSPEPRVRAWQHRLTPVQRALAGNCRLDRDIAALVAGQGFTILRLEREYMEKAPKVSGYLYTGVAAR
jgi:ubiquinone/menaquinone biosynthesis C-methylase UbiE